MLGVAAVVTSLQEACFLANREERIELRLHALDWGWSCAHVHGRDVLCGTDERTQSATTHPVQVQHGITLQVDIQIRQPEAERWRVATSTQLRLRVPRCICCSTTDSQHQVCFQNTSLFSGHMNRFAVHTQRVVLTESG